MSSRNILVPTLDRECIQTAGWQLGDPLLAQRQKESLRLALLFSAEQALVPAGSYFETDDGASAVSTAKPSLERGQIALHGSGGRPEEYVGMKLDQCRSDVALRERYANHGLRLANGLDTASWRPKNEQTDTRLLLNWNETLTAGTHPLLGTWTRAGFSGSRAYREVGAIPAQLESSLMLVDHVAARLPKAIKRIWDYRDTHALRVHLRNGFFESYLADTGAAALVDVRVGVHEAAFPPAFPRLTDGQLRQTLGALDVERQLLQQISSEAFAELVESQTWRCLRPELLARSLEPQPFRAGELRALQRARESKRGGRRAKGKLSLAACLARQHEALERLSAGSFGRTSAALLGQAAEAMAFGARPRLWRGEMLRAYPRSSDRLPGLLEEVLASSTVGGLRQQIEQCDLLLEQYEGFQPRIVAQIVLERRDLRDQARGLSEPVKTALINFGTGTSSSVVGQGLMMALKALGV
jgi:hypothetical protein